MVTPVCRGCAALVNAISGSRTQAPVRPHLPSRAASLVALAVSLFAASSARGAEPRTSSLGWSRLPGAEGCIAPAALARAVEQRLGRAVFVSTSRAELSVEGRVERTKDGFRATVALFDQAGRPLGERELSRDGDRCDAMDAELSLVLAVMIDPEAALAPPPPTALPPAATPAPTTRVVIQREEVPVLVPVPAEPARPLRWYAGAAGAIGLGVLPGAAPGLAVRLGVLPARLPGLELYGVTWAKRRAEGADGRGASDLSLAYAGLAVCPLRGELGRTRLASCAGGELGAITARGVGLDRSREDDRLVGSVVVSGRASVRLAGPLHVDLAVSLGAPLRRDAFFYRNEAGERLDLFRPSPVTATADLGLSVVVPP